MEKAFAVLAMEVTNDRPSSTHFPETPKSAHSATKGFGESLNEYAADKFDHKLDEEIEDHPVTMALIARAG